ncbi:MAG: DUF2474 family protein [Proteobacteria bacterium]|nr:DUF2474 family protein [Pseudomonadota bacterium]
MNAIRGRDFPPRRPSSAAWRHLAWFGGLWVAGVLVLGLVAVLLRLLMRVFGLHG